MGKRIIIHDVDFSENSFTPQQVRQIDIDLAYGNILLSDKWTQYNGNATCIIMRVNPGDVVYAKKTNEYWGTKSAVLYFLQSLEPRTEQTVTTTKPTNNSDADVLIPVGRSKARVDIAVRGFEGHELHEATIVAPDNAQYLYVAVSNDSNDTLQRGYLTPDVLKINGVKVNIPDAGHRIVPQTT